MKCQKVMTLLTEYYDEALSQKISSAVKEHLNRCAECKKKFDELDKSLIILKRLNPLE